MYSGALDLESFSLNDAYSRARQADFEDELEDDLETAQQQETEKNAARRLNFELVHLPSDGELLHVQVQSAVIATVSRDWKVWILDQEQVLPKATFSVDLSRRSGDDDILGLHMDPLGRHVVVSTSGGEAHYVSCALAHFFRLSKAKEGTCVYESIGWNRNNSSDLITSAVLVGSRNGCIYELKVDARAKSSTLELVHQIKNELNPIIGLEVQFCIDQPRKVVVLAVTTTRIYQFSGEGQFDSVFASYSSTSMPNLFEFPDAGSQTQLNSILQVHVRRSEEHAHAFTWLTHAGLVHGTIDTTRNAIQNDSVLYIKNPISMCRQSKEKHWDTRGTFPLSIAISEFHFYLLFEDKFVVISHPPGLPWYSTTHPKTELKPHDINNRTLFSHAFTGGPINRRELPRGVLYDMEKQTTYVYTGNKLLQLLIDDEAGGTWRLYLDRAIDTTERPEAREEFFETALRLSVKETERVDAIRIAMGDFYMTQKRHSDAVKLYAEANRSFEDVVTNLIAREKQFSHDKDQRGVLLEYILARIQVIKNRRIHQTQEQKQLYCLCTWVVELYLERITRLDVTVPRDMRDSFKESQTNNNTIKLETTRARLRDFLIEHKDLLDYETTLQLITSHGRTSEMLDYCQVHGNYAKVVEHYMNANALEAAVSGLASHCTTAADEKLWYSCSPRIIFHFPEKLIKLGWMGAAGAFLQPRKLIPALTKYKPSMNESKDETIHMGIIYLEYITKKEQHKSDNVLHNLLLALYVQQSDHAPLEQFLTESKYYDEKYALRMCLEGQKLRACVYIYSRMHLYEDAVSLALMVHNVSLAKQQANKPNDEEHQKKLWLMIAQHVIEKEHNAKNALELIKESGVIKVEDVLPYFSDSVLIQEFKTEICRSLDDYAEEIRKLKTTMEQATHSANDIRNDTKESRHRFGFISSSEKCSLCKNIVLSRGVGFYVFPSCRHVFHKTCLWNTVLPYVRKESAERANVLIPKLESLRARKSNNEHEILEVKNEIDELLASRCIFCGPLMVEEVDRPFYDSDTAARKMWEL